ncbi:hypothetical protein EZ449_07235 [Pedobacter frigidisoli]|uniref:Uncharacterized protein n=1 Tax=Pedobacter frigidisoli TaxID=2530455 RepID=A0A4R0P2C8_9SPHI|nr:hypothetical protein [Pedobacter frigidisoli]TCD10677.1 hypothetical protein EZ449_07235 [Pedobacter frigidisoli]
MKNRNLIMLLITTICAFGNLSADAKFESKLVSPPIIVTKTFYADNGVICTASLQYNSGQLYNNVKATVQGVTINLVNVSHSGGTINADGWEGVIINGDIEYHIKLLITGSFTIGWQINQAKAETIV